MKVYYCDICGNKMNDERHMLIPIERFDGHEELRIHCKDQYGYCYADICKKCEDRLKDKIDTMIKYIREVEDEKNGIGCSTCEFEKFEESEEPCSVCNHGNGYKIRYKPKEQNTTELYFDDSEICKFYHNGECTNMNICTVVCDGYSNETCRYRDMEKKTLSEAMVKESEE